MYVLFCNVLFCIVMCVRFGRTILRDHRIVLRYGRT